MTSERRTTQWLSVLVVFASAIPAMAAQTRALDAGTVELFGDARLAAGDPGASFDLDAGAGYFLAQGHELGVGTGIHLDGVRQLSVGPLYRYHFLGIAPSFIPYVGGDMDLVYTYVPERRAGGRVVEPARHDGGVNLRAVAGAKVFPQTQWAVLVQLALELDDVGEANDFVMSLGAGFAVYF